MPPKNKTAANAPAAKAPAVPKPKFPRATLENALKLAYAIKTTNGGNPWEPEEIRKAIGVAQGNSWYSLTAASRDYGLTSGTRNIWGSDLASQQLRPPKGKSHRYQIPEL